MMAEQASSSFDLFRSLRNRNYKLYFGGQGLSLIGTWMTQLATSWLVYRLAADQKPGQAAYYLGLVGFAGQLPMLLVSPFAGVIVDRVNRHKLLVITQVLSLIQSLALAILALLQIITIPEVLWLSVLQGMINAFDMPCRQSFMVDIIENREDLPNAIALNSSMFNGARLAGPAMAGLLIGAVGEGYCFLVDAISYIAVIGALYAMTLPKKVPEIHTRNVVAELKEGVQYSFGFTPILALLVLVASVSFATMPVMTLLPLIAVKLSDAAHGAQMLGFLRAASGVGALGGSIYLASRKTVLGLGRVIVISCSVLGVALMGFSQSTTLVWSLLSMLCVGYGMIAVMASANTVLQSIMDDDKRGRVMSFYVMAIMGAAPLGSLASGWAADKWGGTATILVSGAICLVAGLVFALNLPKLRLMVRPIFIQKGIIPEVALGMQAANAVTVPERG